MSEKKSLRKTLSETIDLIESNNYRKDINTDSVLDFANKIIRNISKSGHKVKATNKNKSQAILNYSHWLMRIHKRISYEVLFIRDELSSKQRFKMVIDHLIMKANDCIVSLYTEFDCEPESIEKIEKELFCIRFKGIDFNFYTNLELLSSLELLKKSTKRKPKGNLESELLNFAYNFKL